MPNFLMNFEDELKRLESIPSALMINHLVNAARHRPHPWSTVGDYTSWTSLTDRTWSARALPAYYPEAEPPKKESLIEMFHRPDGKQVLSSKSTCLFPAFAQYLTDGFIRTRMPHSDETDQVRKRNTSNHEIDLCTLYGRTAEQTDALRLKSHRAGERGQLKSQLIGREEFPPFLFDATGSTMQQGFDQLDPPLGLNNLANDSKGPQKRAHLFAAGGDRTNTAPQVAMVNALFLREHNRLAREMESRYPNWDDEQIFQTARNTVIVELIKVVVEDYMNHISPVPFKFVADPAVAWEASWNKPNWITTEFSLLYRWHSLIPDKVTWNGQDIPVGDTFLNNELLTSASLADAFVSLSCQKAARLGAFNTAEALWPIELDSINQGRVCNLAPYADYRAYVSLQKPSSFSDVSTNPAVVDFLARNYTSVDEVDFYIGLFAEDPGVNSPLPELITAMVAVDAFSQALTNPLLSQYVYREETFSPVGWETIQNTSTLEQIVARNCEDLKGRRVSMTQEDWRMDWSAYAPKI